jgi:hypothetical protein
LKLSPAEYLNHIADGLAQREESLGCPAPDGPSSDELRSAAVLLAELLQKENTESFTPTEIWSTMNGLAAVSDKWVDPDADPIANGVRDFLEDTIHELGRVLDTQLPEQAASQQQWANLRVVRHCVNRQVYRQQRNPPLVRRIWNRITGKP